MLVVTIRGGEEKGKCSAVMRELLRIVKDQIGENSAVAMVLSRESTIWRGASGKRETQLKYIDVEEMRVVTNDKHIAGQIKNGSTLSTQGKLLHSKVENVVMNGSTVGELRKVGKEQHLKSTVMNGVRSERGDVVKSVVMNGVESENLGKLEKCENDEETRSRCEERLCKSIIRRLVKRNHEKHTMLADVEEEQEQDVICFDDITGKELTWHAVREGREKELKYLRDLGSV